MGKKLQLLIGIITGVIICIVLYFIVPAVTKLVSGWKAPEILVLITLVGVVVAVFNSIFDRKFKKKQELEKREYEKQLQDDVRNYEKQIKENSLQSLYRIDINVTTLQKNTVLFSASIENVGDKVIVPKISNLYIDQGIKLDIGNKIIVNEKEVTGATYYEFPFILQHNIKEGRPDCILAEKCKVNKLEYPEECIDKIFKQDDKKLYRTNIELEHLSEKSIKYINSKEKFSEDVVMQFSSSGVYRVTFIVTTQQDKNYPDADCQCATKQFFVPHTLEPEIENNINETK